MAGESQQAAKRPNVPAYGNGIVPSYYSGTATRSEVPYSKNARILGYVIVAALVLFIAWFIVSFIMYQT